MNNIVRHLGIQCDWTAWMVMSSFVFVCAHAQ